jgi:hypothetical protein
MQIGRGSEGMIEKTLLGILGGVLGCILVEYLERRKFRKEQEFEKRVDEMKARAYQMGKPWYEITELENKMRDKRRRDQGNPHPIESVLEGSAK